MSAPTPRDPAPRLAYEKYLAACRAQTPRRRPKGFREWSGALSPIQPSDPGFTGTTSVTLNLSEASDDPR